MLETDISISLNTLYNGKKQKMKKVYRVITLTIYYLFVVEGMVLTDGMEYLHYLLQKNYRYEHHLQNYQTSLKTGLIPNGLKIKKSPAITPV